MARLIRRAEMQTNSRRVREFCYVSEPGSGYSFPVDAAGQLAADDGGPLNPAAVANFTACLSGVVDGQAVIDRGIIVHEWSFRVPGAIACDGCGAEIDLERDVNSCDRCERDYSYSGQAYAPRAQWGEETGETYADIVRGGGPFADD